MTSRILCSVALILAALNARADEVWVKGLDKSVKGDVKKESAKEVQIAVGKKSESFPGAQIVDIQYDSIRPAALNLAGGEYRAAKAAEKDFKESTDPAKRKSALRKAIDNYGETLKLMEKNIYPARQFQYKIAVLSLDLANLEGEKTDKALAKLLQFKSAFPNSWQINKIMPLVAQLQMDAKDYKGAEQTFQEMAEMTDLPEDVRREAQLNVVQVSVQAGNIEQAGKKLEELSKKPGASPIFLARVKMARADLLVGQKKIDEATPILQQLLKETTDKQIKALAHNALGECLYKANRYEDALWEFLWVDTVFNQDRAQRAKALYFLWQTFERLNNAERAQECREALTDPAYAGTEYQRLAAAKTK